jgi:hypothetical protein
MSYRNSKTFYVSTNSCGLWTITPVIGFFSFRYTRLFIPNPYCKRNRKLYRTILPLMTINTFKSTPFENCYQNSQLLTSDITDIQIIHSDL